LVAGRGFEPLTFGL